MLVMPRVYQSGVQDDHDSTYTPAVPTITDSAICIRHWDFSETSQTVSLFARDHGVLRGLAKGAKREKGRFSGGIDLLARGQFVGIVKPGRDLVTLTEWDLSEVHWPLRQDLAAHRTGLYMADLIHHMLTDHDPHPTLFEGLAAALSALRRDDEPGRERTLLRFQWELLLETGYKPELRSDANTGRALSEDEPTFAFSPRAGGLVSDTGQNALWRVRRETVALLRSVADNNDRAQQDFTDSPIESLQRANRLLASYLREILGKELTTSRWLFPDLR